MPYRKIDTGEMDTEGNMPLRKVTDSGEPDSGDAEGNGVRVRFDKDAADDDAEGNGIRFRTVEDGADEDAEGNGVRYQARQGRSRRRHRGGT